MHPEQLLYLSSSLSAALINGTEDWYAFNPKRILVVKLDEIGDMVYTIHVLEALREAHPNAEITVYCKAVCKNLIDLLRLDRIVHTPEILRESFNLHIDLRGNFKTLGAALMRRTDRYLERGSIRLRNKFSGGQQHERFTNWDIVQPVLNNLSYRDPQIRVEEEDTKYVHQLLSERGIGPYIVMHCGARETIRRWPGTRFREVAVRIQEEYGYATVLCGAQGEFDLNEEIASGIPYIHNLAGLTSLRQLSELSKNALMFIGNESGPLHFANVAGIPLIGLFGAGVQEVFYPYSDPSYVLHPLNLPLDKRMLAITVDEVYALTVKILNSSNSTH